MQTYKGWFYVCATSVLLFVLIRNEINKKEKIEDELKFAKSKAEESDNLKSAFLSNMSHEIRTPLNGILGFSELLLDNSYNSTEKEVFAKQLSTNGNDLLKLITDIMDVSRIQENQIEISLKHFNINTLLEAIYFEFAHSDLKLMRNNVDFMLVKGDDNAENEIISDPIWITHIFQKLLNNAFFFTQKGFIRFGYLNIENGIEFFVEDSGSGIDESNQHLIFKPFFKGKNKLVGSKGFGLGLAICNGLVQLLGGELQFSSSVNKGSRFYFQLDNEHLHSEKSSSKRQTIDL